MKHENSISSRAQGPGIYYKILGLSESASLEDIKKAYREKTQRHHPDRGGDSHIYQAIREAYKGLVNGSYSKSIEEILREATQQTEWIEMRERDIRKQNVESFFFMPPSLAVACVCLCLGMALGLGLLLTPVLESTKDGKEIQRSCSEVLP